MHQHNPFYLRGGLVALIFLSYMQVSPQGSVQVQNLDHCGVLGGEGEWAGWTVGLRPQLGFLLHKAS